MNTTNSKIKEPSTSFRASEITYKGTAYTNANVVDLCKFAAWLVGNTSDYFYMLVEKTTFRVQFRNEAGNFIALCPEFVDMSDPVFMCSSRNSHEEALRGLAEQISERLLSEMV